MTNDHQPGSKAPTMDEPDDPHAPVELTGFQRDLLFVIRKLEDQNPHGKVIKRELGKHHADEINTGRLYQNLRELTDCGLVDTHPIDGRTKAYRLSDLGHERLESYHEWIVECLRHENESRDADSYDIDHRPNRP